MYDGIFEGILSDHQCRYRQKEVTPMPKRIISLSDAQVRTAKPADKEYKLADGGGLYLLVTSAGGKLWRFDYRYADKRKTASFGAYPQVTLGDARRLRDETKKMLANNIDPGANKKAQKAAKSSDLANSFEVIAREWHGVKKDEWSESHADKMLQRFEMNIFPWMGARPISEIEPPEVLEVLRRMESRGALETAKKMKYACGQVFRYAVASGRATRDQTADLKDALKTPLTKNMAALTTPKAVAELLRASDEYSGTFVVKCALRLAPLFFCRPGELRHTEWSEIDFEKAELNIPFDRLKMRKTEKLKNMGKFFLIPLSRQSLAILKELHPLTRHSKYVFPGHRSPVRCMSENAVLLALRKMGFTREEMTGHGFRAMARTMIREQLHLDAEYIEIQLAHKTKAPNGTAYDRVSFLPERRQMMQTWADYLDSLKDGVSVLPR
jgi:integrase